MASSYFKKCVGIYALQPKLYRDIRPVFPLGLSECLQVRLMDTIGSCGNRKSYDIRMPAGFLHTVSESGKRHIGICEIQKIGNEFFCLIFRSHMGNTPINLAGDFHSHRLCFIVRPNRTAKNAPVTI